MISHVFKIELRSNYGFAIGKVYYSFPCVEEVKVYTKSHVHTMPLCNTPESRGIKIIKSETVWAHNDVL